MQLILFDIDATLLRTGGVGVASCNRAFEELFQIANAWGNTEAHGKTDPMIFQEIAQATLRRKLETRELAEVTERYSQLFSEELDRSNSFQVLPGVHKICQTLSSHPGRLLGIQTGNIEQTAWLKLKRGNLADYFEFGGFSSDAPTRREFVTIALERAQDRAAQPISSTVLIGDSANDIDAGRSIGATTIAVCTGNVSRAAFAKHQPDYILDDLSATADVLELLDTARAPVS